MFADRLKKSLLQAAIQGQLTEQLPTDGDARDLLRKIRAEKTKLIATKKIKAEKPLPLVTDDEIPFDIPDNWCWVRLGDICDYGTNETILPAAMEQGKLLVDLEDIEKDSGKLINRKFFDGKNANSSKNVFRCGQVLFGKLRVYLNKVIVADDDGYCSSEILPLDFGKNILNEYAQVVLMSPTFLSYANAYSYGTKMPRLGTKAGQLALFPLPPLAEQERIVEKLNELLSEVDELAKDERELVELEETFPRQMKNSLLQAAIQGKLTEQLPSDGNARDLLRKIRTEKAKLLAEKKIKAEKTLLPITDKEIPFDIPDNWCWCRLGDICDYGTNETILPSDMERGKLLIDLEDIKKDSGKLINRKFFDGNNANSSKHIFRCGQVLFGKLRVYLNKVIVADEDGYCSSEILPLEFGKNILNRYAQIFLMSPTFLSYANSCSYGTKMPRLGTKAGQFTLFPLPPLDEQKRIVERMEELLPLCKDNCYKDL